MNNSLKACISKKPQTDSIVSCRTVHIRERLLRWLLGFPCRMTVLIPGDSVGSIAITELPEGSVGT